MASEDEVVRYTREMRREINRLSNRETEALTAAYADAFRQIEARVAKDAARRAEIYGEAVFDQEAVLALELGRELDALAPQIAAQVEGAMNEHLRLAIESGQRQVELEAGRVGVQIGGLNRDATLQLVQRAHEGRPISRLIEGHNEAFRQQLGHQLLVGQTLGKNPREVARNLHRTMGRVQGGTLARYVTIARTEMNDASRRGLTALYQRHSNVLKGKERMCTLDERTCIACIALDGVIYPLDAQEDDHQNGRCTWLPVIKDFPGVKVRKRKLGKDWFKKLPDATKRRMLGEKAFASYKTGLFNLDDFVVLRDNPGWRPAFYQSTYPQALKNSELRDRLWERMTKAQQMAVGHVGGLAIGGLAVKAGYAYSKITKVAETLDKTDFSFEKVIEKLIKDQVGKQAKTKPEDTISRLLGRSPTPASRSLPPVTSSRQLDEVAERFDRGVNEAVRRVIQGSSRRAGVRPGDPDWMARTLDEIPPGFLPETFVTPQTRTELEALIRSQIEESFIRSQPLEVVAPVRMKELTAGAPVVDEWTPWGAWAPRLRQASRILPGQAYWLDREGVVKPNEELVAATYQRTVAAFDPETGERVGTMVSTISSIDGSSESISVSLNIMISGEIVDVDAVQFDPLWYAHVQEQYRQQGSSSGWKVVGSSTRRMYSSEYDGPPRVYHASQHLETWVQGYGWSNSYNFWAFAFYAAHGMRKVTVQTADVGSYTWATHGFESDNMTALQIVSGRDYQIRRMIQDGHITDAQLSTYLNRIVAFHEQHGGMKSYELSQLGREDSWVEEETVQGMVRQHRMWFGKRVMMQSGWSGTLLLEPGTEGRNPGVFIRDTDLFPKYPRYLTNDALGRISKPIEPPVRAFLVHMLAAGGMGIPQALVQVAQTGEVPETVLQVDREEVQAVALQVDRLLERIRDHLLANPGRVTVLQAINEIVQQDRRFEGLDLTHWMVELSRVLPGEPRLVTQAAPPPVIQGIAVEPPAPAPVTPLTPADEALVDYLAGTGPFPAPDPNNIRFTFPETPAQEPFDLDTAALLWDRYRGDIEILRDTVPDEAQEGVLQEFWDEWQQGNVPRLPQEVVQALNRLNEGQVLGPEWANFHMELRRGFVLADGQFRDAVTFAMHNAEWGEQERTWMSQALAGDPVLARFDEWTRVDTMAQTVIQDEPYDFRPRIGIIAMELNQALREFVQVATIEQGAATAFVSRVTRRVRDWMDQGTSVSSPDFIRQLYLRIVMEADEVSREEVAEMGGAVGLFAGMRTATTVARRVRQMVTGEVPWAVPAQQGTPEEPRIRLQTHQFRILGEFIRQVPEFWRLAGNDQATATATSINAFSSALQAGLQTENVSNEASLVEDLRHTIVNAIMQARPTNLNMPMSVAGEFADLIVAAVQETPIRIFTEQDRATLEQAILAELQQDERYPHLNNWYHRPDTVRLHIIEAMNLQSLVGQTFTDAALSIPDLSDSWTSAHDGEEVEGQVAWGVPPTHFANVLTSARDRFSGWILTQMETLERSLPESQGPARLVGMEQDPNVAGYTRIKDLYYQTLGLDPQDLEHYEQWQQFRRRFEEAGSSNVSVWRMQLEQDYRWWNNIEDDGEIVIQYPAGLEPLAEMVARWIGNQNVRRLVERRVAEATQNEIDSYNEVIDTDEEILWTPTIRHHLLSAVMTEYPSPEAMTREWVEWLEMQFGIGDASEFGEPDHPVLQPFQDALQVLVERLVEVVPPERPLGTPTSAQGSAEQDSAAELSSAEVLSIFSNEAIEAMRTVANQENPGMTADEVAEFILETAGLVREREQHPFHMSWVDWASVFDLAASRVLGTHPNAARERTNWFWITATRLVTLYRWYAPEIDPDLLTRAIRRELPAQGELLDLMSSWIDEFSVYMREAMLLSVSMHLTPLVSWEQVGWRLTVADYDVIARSIVRAWIDRGTTSVDAAVDTAMSRFNEAMGEFYQDANQHPAPMIPPFAEANRLVGRAVSIWLSTQGWPAPSQAGPAPAPAPPIEVGQMWHAPQWRAVMEVIAPPDDGNVQIQSVVPFEGRRQTAVWYRVGDLRANMQLLSPEEAQARITEYTTPESTERVFYPPIEQQVYARVDVREEARQVVEELAWDVISAWNESAIEESDEFEWDEVQMADFVNMVMTNYPSPESLGQNWQGFWEDEGIDVAGTTSQDLIQALGMDPALEAALERVADAVLAPRAPALAGNQAEIWEQFLGDMERAMARLDVAEWENVVAEADVHVREQIGHHDDIDATVMVGIQEAIRANEAEAAGLQVDEPDLGFYREFSRALQSVAQMFQIWQYRNDDFEVQARVGVFNFDTSLAVDLDDPEGRENTLVVANALDWVVDSYPAEGEALVVIPAADLVQLFQNLPDGIASTGGGVGIRFILLDRSPEQVLALLDDASAIQEPAVEPTPIEVGQVWRHQTTGVQYQVISVLPGDNVLARGIENGEERTFGVAQLRLVAEPTPVDPLLDILNRPTVALGALQFTGTPEAWEGLLQEAFMHGILNAGLTADQYQELAVPLRTYLTPADPNDNWVRQGRVLNRLYDAVRDAYIDTFSDHDIELPGSSDLTDLVNWTADYISERLRESSTGVTWQTYLRNMRLALLEEIAGSDYDMGHESESIPQVFSAFLFYQTTGPHAAEALEGNERNIGAAMVHWLNATREGLRQFVVNQAEHLFQAGIVDWDDVDRTSADMQQHFYQRLFQWSQANPWTPGQPPRPQPAAPAAPLPVPPDPALDSTWETSVAVTREVRDILWGWAESAIDDLNQVGREVNDEWDNYGSDEIEDVVEGAMALWPNVNRVVVEFRRILDQEYTFEVTDEQGLLDQIHAAIGEWIDERRQAPAVPAVAPSVNLAELREQYVSQWGTRQSVVYGQVRDRIRAYIRERFDELEAMDDIRSDPDFEPFDTEELRAVEDFALQGWPRPQAVITNLTQYFVSEWGVGVYTEDLLDQIIGLIDHWVRERIPVAAPPTPAFAPPPSAYTPSPPPPPAQTPVLVSPPPTMNMQDVRAAAEFIANRTSGSNSSDIINLVGPQMLGRTWDRVALSLRGGSVLDDMDDDLRADLLNWIIDHRPLREPPPAPPPEPTITLAGVRELAGSELLSEVNFLIRRFGETEPLLEAIKRYIEDRQAGATVTQAVAGVAPDLLGERFYDQPVPTQQLQITQLTNEVMSAAFGGSRYGAAPQQRSLEQVAQDLEAQGVDRGTIHGAAVSRPDALADQEAQLLHAAIKDDLAAGRPPRMADLKELGKLLGRSPYDTMKQILEERAPIFDAGTMREYLADQLGAGFNLDPNNIYVRWLGDVTGMAIPDIIEQTQQDFIQRRDEGPGTPRAWGPIEGAPRVGWWLTTDIVEPSAANVGQIIQTSNQADLLRVQWLNGTQSTLRLRDQFFRVDVTRFEQQVVVAPDALAAIRVGTSTYVVTDPYDHEDREEMPDFIPPDVLEQELGLMQAEQEALDLAALEEGISSLELPQDLEEELEISDREELISWRMWAAFLRPLGMTLATESVPAEMEALLQQWWYGVEDLVADTMWEWELDPRYLVDLTIRAEERVADDISWATEVWHKYVDLWQTIGVTAEDNLAEYERRILTDLRVAWEQYLAAQEIEPTVVEAAQATVAAAHRVAERIADLFWEVISAWNDAQPDGDWDDAPEMDVGTWDVIQQREWVEMLMESYPDLEAMGAQWETMWTQEIGRGFTTAQDLIDRISDIARQEQGPAADDPAAQAAEIFRSGFEGAVLLAFNERGIATPDNDDVHPLFDALLAAYEEEMGGPFDDPLELNRLLQTRLRYMIEDTIVEVAPDLQLQDYARNLADDIVEKWQQLLSPPGAIEPIGDVPPAGPNYDPEREDVYRQHAALMEQYAHQRFENEYEMRLFVERVLAQHEPRIRMEQLNIVISPREDYLGRADSLWDPDPHQPWGQIVVGADGANAVVVLHEIAHLILAFRAATDGTPSAYHGAEFQILFTTLAEQYLTNPEPVRPIAEPPGHWQYSADFLESIRLRWSEYLSEFDDALDEERIEFALIAALGVAAPWEGSRNSTGMLRDMMMQIIQVLERERIGWNQALEDFLDRDGLDEEDWASPDEFDQSDYVEWLMETVRDELVDVILQLSDYDEGVEPAPSVDEQLREGLSRSPLYQIWTTFFLEHPEWVQWQVPAEERAMIDWSTEHLEAAIRALISALAGVGAPSEVMTAWMVFAGSSINRPTDITEALREVAQRPEFQAMLEELRPQLEWADRNKAAFEGAVRLAFMERGLEIDETDEEGLYSEITGAYGAEVDDSDIYDSIDDINDDMLNLVLSVFGESPSEADIALANDIVFLFWQLMEGL